MQKNVYAYIVLLSIVSFVSISADEVTVDDVLIYFKQLQTYFNKLLEIGRLRINYKTRKMMPALTTLPASVPDKALETFKKYTTQLVEITADILEDNITMAIKHELFTPTNRYKAYKFDFTFDSFQKSPFDPALETKVLIHGFRETLPKSSVYYDIKNKLLEVGRYNVLLVDWTFYSFNSFDTTATHAMFVGVQFAKFLFSLTHYKNISAQSIHIIAHGMGCHAAGMVGKLIPGIGRITGLDATGFLYDDLPQLLKLTSTDAEFVDAIHTHGSSSYSEGIGTLYNYGDIDFFPNGGSVQPGCIYGSMYMNKDKKVTLIKDGLDIIMCNHERALFLFLESISDCPFVAVNCESYGDFIIGNCPPQSSTIANMGFHARKITHEVEHSFYLLFTSGTYPFCIS